MEASGRLKQLMRWLEGAMMAALALLPLIAQLAHQPFWLDLATRLVILAMAAASLNIILGLGGLVSFGHAAFLGIGAYAVGIPVHHSIYGGASWLASDNGLFHFALAVGAGALFALVTGALSLRTKGVHFIMITMAFGQMIYYLLESLETYGGNDGLTLDVRSALPGIDLDNPAQLYWLAFVILAGVLVMTWRLRDARFGLALAGARENARRMAALGHDVTRIRLAAYVLAGAICALAGALMANSTAFITPAMTSWPRSGELMFMVILGGAGRILGPVLGAGLFVLLEEALSSFTTYWHLPFGLLLILAALWQAEVFTTRSGGART